MNQTMKKKYKLEEFIQSKLEFTQTDHGGFSHNFDRDLHFIILWENGRYKESDILDEITSRFDLIYCAEITWSDKHILANFNRLYSLPNDSVADLSKLKSVGMGPFLCVVFEDKDPKYGYVKSLGGEVSIGNTKVVEFKYYLRDLLQGNLVHGTSGIKEFFHHGSLLFHESKLINILSIEKWDGKFHLLKQDLAGANGWESFSEFINIANYCSDWIVLRNFEFLPNDFWNNDKDLDVLCDSLSILSSSINAKKAHGNISAYEIVVEGKNVPIDIRYVGDNYYDPVWESHILGRKTFYNSIVPRARDDDYFFSLLYHAKIQKPSVKDVYIPRLKELAMRIGFANFKEEYIVNDKSSALIINGFMKEHGFSFYQPLDNGVYLNREVFQYINRTTLQNEKDSREQLIQKIIKLIPQSAKRAVPGNLKEAVLRRIYKLL